MIEDLDLDDKEVFRDGTDDNQGSDADGQTAASPNPAAEGETDSVHGPIASFDYVPREAELRQELSGIVATASEFEAVSRWLNPKDTYANSRRLEVQAKLTSDIEKLQRYKVALDREVLRCERNLERIHSDAERLNLPATMECYSEAERQQQKQYYEAISDRDAIVWTLTKAQAALRTPQNMSVPAWDPFPPHLPVNLPLPRSQSHPGGLGNEVDGLLSLGPLGNRQRQRY